MSINISTNFSVNASIPVDTRLSIPDHTLINFAYQGLLVFDTTLNNYYSFQGTSWEVLSTGGGSGTTGSGILYDNFGIPSINYFTRVLTDSSANTSVDWKNRQLFNSSGVLVLDWSYPYLADNGGHNAMNWNTRNLYDSSVTSALDWQNRLLYDEVNALALRYNTTNRDLIDISGTTSLDWNTRTLYASDGSISFEYNGVNYLNIFKGLALAIAGKTFSYSPGTNQMAGVGTLVSGTVSISNTLLDPTLYYIILQYRNPSGTLGHLTYSIVGSTGFTVTSTLDDGSTTQTLDNSTFIYFIFQIV
jgi:hypothetical protein